MGVRARSRLTDNPADAAQTSILVNRLGRARLTDFILAGIDPGACSTYGVTEMGNGTTRWTAPELLDEPGPPTKKADVFSFAMVMIEVGYSTRCAVLPVN